LHSHISQWCLAFNPLVTVYLYSSPTHCFFVSCIRHSASALNRGSHPPGNTQNE
jgi:hypothetical protein